MCPSRDLQAFYRNYYQPDNAILLVAGKFDESKTLELVSRKFASIPRPARTLTKLYTTEPVQDGERAVTVRRVGDVQNVMAVYHVPARSHPDFASIDILSRVLADMPSGPSAQVAGGNPKGQLYLRASVSSCENQA